jgi:hypothetical protein
VLIRGFKKEFFGSGYVGRRWAGLIRHKAVQALILRKFFGALTALYLAHAD